MAEAETVALKVGDKLYAGWTEVSVTRGLDAASGQFTLSLAHKDDAAAPEPFPVKAGDRCQLLIGGNPVVDGWVDVARMDGDGSDHRISLIGRDRTGDLADCSAIHKPGSWTNVKLEAIAAELAKPFGIGVSAKVSTGAAIRKFALQQGESPQAAIERLLRFRGLMAVPTASGDLEIVKADEGAPVATLEYGRNILSWAVTHDHSQRFSRYVVKGQAAGDDHANGKAVSAIRGEASDAGVTRYRPLLIVAEEQGDRGSAGTRAAFEAGVRAGKALTADITLLGWRVADGGALWRPNMRARLILPAGGIADQVMLVAAVTFTKGDGGTTTRLTLNPPGAWAQLAQGEKP